MDRSELVRQPVVSTVDEGPRGEMAEGLLATDKNFKVTSVSIVAELQGNPG